MFQTSFQTQTNPITEWFIGVGVQELLTASKKMLHQAKNIF